MFYRIAVGLAALCALTMSAAGQAIIIDHTAAHSHQELFALGQPAIEKAKQKLHITYGHTSHGSQIITGMSSLDAFMHTKHSTPTGLYAWNDGPLAGALDIDDYFVDGDLGNPDYVTWAARTRTYLNIPANADVNVVIWSWCGQADTTPENINTYLSLMTQLEIDYPKVKFIYMTGHLNGTGATGNLNLRNEQIRTYCRNNGKILYDFADIESYDPDELTNYMALKCNDNCDYDSNGDGSLDKNWATDWQTAHPGEWYNCSPAHTQPLNGNLKAYAAWNLWVAIANALDVAAVERWEVLATHGAKGELATTIQDNFIEPRLAGLKKLRATFSAAIDPATLGPGAVTIIGNASGNQSALIGTLALDGTGKLLTIPLASALPNADAFTITITNQVQKAGGGDIQGDRDIVLKTLAGDVNASGKVTSGDLLAMRSYAGQTVSGTNAARDVDCSGTLNGSDLLSVRGCLGAQLP